MTLRTLACHALRLLLAMVAVALALPAFAQSTTTYVAASDGTLNSSTVCSNGPLVRTFDVSTSFIINDVNLGLFLEHNIRGDIRVVLESPSGTRAQLMNGGIWSVTGANLNVLFDDNASQQIHTEGDTISHPTTAPPPFAYTLRPTAPLSVFKGEQANGTWRLEICDLWRWDGAGTFRHAELYLQSLPTNHADLSLSKALVGAAPVQGGTASWRLTVTNAATSTAAATSITVRDSLPSGFTFASASGSGSFNPATGDWTIASLAPGESVMMTITGTVSSSAGAVLTNTAQIIASSLFDPDSTPGNAITSEDDFASASFTVQSGRAPGTPPLLPCTTGTSVFDWDTISGWNPGETSKSYAFASFGNINFNLSTDGYLVWNGTYGGQSPTVYNAITGGLSPAERSLHFTTEQWNRNAVGTITITLPRAFTGVQFSIFDVDFSSGQFADRLVVTGANGAVAVTPTLTNGNANYLSGSQVIGDYAASDSTANGTVVVTFTEPVTTITIQLGNHTTAPSDPNAQAIALHDISVCAPNTSLSVTKVSSVISDPINGTTNPKAIPGALIEYLITLTNTGSGATDPNSVLVWDEGSADAKLCRLSSASGPVSFANGTPASGLAYTFTSLASTTDALEFSSNGGSSWDYVPSADSDDCDTAITNFRVRPSGAFAAGGKFTLGVRYQVE